MSFYKVELFGIWSQLFKYSNSIVKLGSLLSHTEWSNILERNSNLIENPKKGPELTL